MKGCIILTRESGHILHEIAAKLHSQYGVNSFCALEHNEGLEYYARSQNNVSYTAFLKTCNLYTEAKSIKIDKKELNRIEKIYGKPFLWPYIIADKNVMLTFPAKIFFSYQPSHSHEEMQKILQVFFKKTEEFFLKERPDFLLTIGVGSLGTYVPFTVAKKMGIKTLDMQSSRLRDLTITTSEFTKFSDVEKIFDDIRSKKSRGPFHKNSKLFLEEFRKNPQTYLPIFIQFEKKSQLKFLKPANIRRTLQMINRVIKNYVRSVFSGYRTINPLRFILELTTKKVRSFWVTRLYEWPNYNENFCFFPLQMEPEVGNSATSPLFTNYIELARLIAKSLPMEHKLYIKEHPIMRGVRKSSYYKKLLQIPNVKLINDAVPSATLISSSQAIFTTVGTVGWEAILLKKPVITFGNTFYNKLSTVIKCSDSEKLASLVNEVLNRFRADDEELVDFISAILEESVQFDFISLINLESDKNASQIIKQTDGFNDMVKLIATKISRA